MNKQVIRLSENQLHNIVDECLKTVLSEEQNDMGYVRYSVVDNDSNPRCICGGETFLHKEDAVKQLKYARYAFPDNNWTIEAEFVIKGGKTVHKNLGAIPTGSVEPSLPA